jgi:RNA polymerase sigma-70 factor (ECF subfamily)
MNAPLPMSHCLPMRAALVEVVPSLRAHARRLSAGNRDEAEELVQDTLERALRFEASYATGTNLRAWTHQILFSVFITRCRRRRRERRALESLSCDPCSWTRQDAAPEMSLLTRRVESALEALPRQFAAVVRLVDLGELSYKEAAERLRVPVGTVMSRLFRGRKLLAVALDDRQTQAELAPLLVSARAA